MKAMFKNIWLPVKGLVIRDLDKNLFVFQFFYKKNKEFVLKEGTWTFDGCLLLVKNKDYDMLTVW